MKERNPMKEVKDLPVEAIAYVTQYLAVQAMRHQPGEWRSTDNHGKLVNHYGQWKLRTGTEDHLVNMICRGLFCLQLRLENAEWSPTTEMNIGKLLKMQSASENPIQQSSSNTKTKKSGYRNRKYTRTARSLKKNPEVR